jgi:hypothetical protein
LLSCLGFESSTSCAANALRFPQFALLSLIPRLHLGLITFLGNRGCVALRLSVSLVCLLPNTHISDAKLHLNFLEYSFALRSSVSHKLIYYLILHVKSFGRNYENVWKIEIPFSSVAETFPSQRPF